jgi:hypothetical protein
MFDNIEAGKDSNDTGVLAHKFRMGCLRAHRQPRPRRTVRLASIHYRLAVHDDFDAPQGGDGWQPAVKFQRKALTCSTCKMH